MLVFPPDQWEKLAHLEAEGEDVCQNQPRTLADEMCVVKEDGSHHSIQHLLQLLMVHKAPLPRVEVLGLHVLDLSGGVGIPHLD